MLRIGETKSRMLWGTAMDHVTAIIGHLAWPVALLILGYWLVRELRKGLITALLPNGGTLKAGGVELEVRAAGASLKAAGVEQPSTPVQTNQTPETEEVISDETPYDRLIEAWRNASYALAELSSKNGGSRDARRSYENIDVLEERSVLPHDVAEAARSLFKARNSTRRSPPEQVTEEVASEFVTNTKALLGYLRSVS